MGNNSSKGKIIITFIMKSLDDKFNINLYNKLVKEFGDDYRSLNWGSSLSQEKRFEILNTIGNIDRSSILDVGCGLSHFYNWLKRNKIQVNYTGIDITPIMVEESRKKYPEAIFFDGSIFNTDLSKYSFDYVFASGIFYLRNESPMEYLQKTIIKLYELAKIGIAFNNLSSWSNVSDQEFYADPIEVINFCKSLTSKIVFRHDYHNSDFTIILYK
jgi:SAM-dependent methyltransferase